MKKLLVGSLMTCLILSPRFATPSWSEEPVSTADLIAEQIDSVAEPPAELAYPELSGVNDDLTAASDDGTIAVEISGEGNSLAIESMVSDSQVGLKLPIENDADDAVVAENGTVVFASEDGSDLAVQVIDDGSVRIETVIPSNEVSHEFRYPLELPAGTELSLTEEGGVLGLDPQGNFVMGIDVPWARDVAGASVETYYSLEGHTVVQVVEKVAADQYPVVADPWLGIALIKSVKKAKNSSGWRYSVDPTAFGRSKIAIGARWASWSEAKSKGVPQTKTLENQYYCHYDAGVFTVFKNTWNLEAYTKDKGYWGFVRSLCN